MAKTAASRYSTVGSGDLISQPGFGVAEVSLDPGQIGASPMSTEAGVPVSSTEGPVEITPPSDIGLVTEAMRRAAPRNKKLRRAYFVGALAAARRRADPRVAPEPWDVPPEATATDAYGDLRIQDMPLIAHPIVEMIRSEMPDLVMAADRGGRILGLAVHATWRRRYPKTPFPTLGGKVHFGRFSTDHSRDSVNEILAHILNSSGVMAEMAQRREDKDGRKLTVLFLDDWVAGGGTLNMICELLARNGLNRDTNLRLLVGTMSGSNLWSSQVDLHVRGRSNQSGVTWGDSGEELGVDYSLPRNRYELGLTPRPARTVAPRTLRRDLYAAIQKQVEPSPLAYNRRPAPNIAPPSRSRIARISRRLFRKVANTAF
jgi:hypothetical protein